MWLHRYAKFVSAATVLLIVAGGLVTSTGSGLAVPDWPTSYGWNMFTFPMKHMVGGIFYEHGHRLIASGVGFLTIILALWLWSASLGGGCAFWDLRRSARSACRGCSAASPSCGFFRRPCRPRMRASRRSSSV